MSSATHLALFAQTLADTPSSAGTPAPHAHDCSFPPLAAPHCILCPAQPVSALIPVANRDSAALHTASPIRDQSPARTSSHPQPHRLPDPRRRYTPVPSAAATISSAVRCPAVRSGRPIPAEHGRSPPT